MIETIGIYFFVGIFVTLAFVHATWDEFERKREELGNGHMAGATLIIWILWPTVIISKWLQD